MSETDNFSPQSYHENEDDTVHAQASADGGHSRQISEQAHDTVLSPSKTTTIRIDPNTINIPLPTKGKKLSEKGKLKLAEKRSHLMLQQYYEELALMQGAGVASIYSRRDGPQSPVYDEDGNEIPVEHEASPRHAEDEIWREPGLNEDERYELLLQYNLAIIQQDEAKRRVQKHQRKLNELRNASKTNTKIRDFGQSRTPLPLASLPQRTLKHATLTSVQLTTNALLSSSSQTGSTRSKDSSTSTPTKR